jgi:hypothetical protein
MRPRGVDHGVQFYGEEAGLADVVARYVAEGLRHEEASILFAPAAHAGSFLRALEALGLDPRAAAEEGRLRVVDAEETLSRIMGPDGLDLPRFRSIVEATLEEVRRGSRIPGVRIYGEIVDLLWKSGRLEAAIRLEEIWSELIRERRFRLLCGYGMDLLAPELDGGAFGRVCDAHEEVRSNRVRDRLEAAVDGALDDVLGASLAEAIRPLILATLGPSGPLGRAERTVLWIRRNLPAKAGDVLDRARRRYGRLDPKGPQA